MIKLYKYIAVAAVSCIMIGCVKDDDFSVPEALGTEENKGLEALLTSDATEILIADLKLKYSNNHRKPVFIENDLYLKGYVTSSDKESNFFKEIFLQDAPNNPTAGIKLILNQVKTYNQYNVGREVFINLKGLYIGEERVGNGVLTIGGLVETDQYGTTVKRLTEKQRVRQLFRSENTLELIALPLEFSEVTDAHIGLYVQFDNLEFAEDLEGARYFDPVQDFDTSRQMQVCSENLGYSYFPMETKSFATFKDVLLPTGNGTITGVISKTFDGSALVLKVNDLEAVNLSQQRCTPRSIEDFEIIFQEDFASAVDLKELDLTGWTNFNQAGSVKWVERTVEQNGFVEFNPLGSGNASNVGWLITPSIRKDASAYLYLNFKAAQSGVRSATNIIEVMVSTDFNGADVLSATWHKLEAFLPSQNSMENEFLDSGFVDLSSYEGMLYIGFKVTGNGRKGSASGAYQLDNIRILRND